MLVCHCNGVSDRAIKNAVRRGANSPREAASACGAGTSCGGCRPAIQEIVRSELSQREGAPAIASSDNGIQIKT